MDDSLEFHIGDRVTAVGDLWDDDPEFGAREGTITEVNDGRTYRVLFDDGFDAYLSKENRRWAEVIRPTASKGPVIHHHQRNPQTDPDNKPFTVGDRITLIGKQGRKSDGTPLVALVFSVEWNLEREGGFWLVNVLVEDDIDYPDVLAWHECDCCLLWGEKIS